jgi:hypothetical protein
MARKKHNIHYIYKTTCNITGRWYVGMHSTSNIDDGYMGSGKILRHSIRKHGIENHTKEILEFVLTREELILREIEIVNIILITNSMCMNLKEGGCGGFINDEHKDNFLKAGRKAFKEKLINDEEFRNNYSLKQSENTKKAILEGRIKTWKELYDWTDKKHSEETKELISEIKKGTGTGDTNSQHGTCWVTKDGVNKKIKKENINDYLLDNWVKGRFTELKGELINNSKLTNDDVIKIKKLLDEGKLSQVKIGSLFNVHQETISKIKRKLIWK